VTRYSAVAAPGPPILRATLAAMEEYTPEMLAMLERQREYFSSDEMREERAAVWRDATPQECLAALAESCAEAAYFLSLYSPEMLEKVLEPEPLPGDTVEILTRLWQTRAR
jgi:hypothetical protein